MLVTVLIWLATACGIGVVLGLLLLVVVLFFAEHKINKES